jgi:hypothetical protein
MSLQDKALIVGIISACFSLAMVLGKWFVVIPLKHFIQEQTHPIQPDANGGKSLPDIARTTIEIKTNLENIMHQVDKIENRLDVHISQHNTGAI